MGYSLAIQGIAAELLLVDLKEAKLASEVQDLRDAVLYCPHDVIINGGTYADLGDCDVITNLIYQESGLPKGHVFGTGTGLDSSRLISQRAQQTDVAPQSISAYMIGEHGASQMAA